MPLNSKVRAIFLLVTLSGGLVTVAFAENVRIRTQFPSPYGTYGTATSTGSSTFASTTGESLIGGGGGRIFVGVANTDNRTLSVMGDVANLHTAAFRRNATGWGVELGRHQAFPNAGSIQANNGAGTSGLLNLNSNGTNSRVGIGTTTPQFALHVHGGIQIIRGGANGTLQFSRASDGNYYSQYAP